MGEREASYRGNSLGCCLRDDIQEETMQMARKGQGIGIVDGLQGGFGGEDFLRELVQRTVQRFWKRR